MRNIAVFASGSGTNAENIINHFSKSGKARVKLVLTENPSAYVLERAKRLKIPTHIFSKSDLSNGRVLSLLLRQEIDFIVLAGFLKLMPTAIVDKFSRRIVNIHPALLPKYGGKGMYGAYVHKAVIDAKESKSGITIHLVNSQYDKGDILFQAECDVMPCDTPELLAERIHNLEYQYFPRVVEEYIDKIF
ncbi:MAG TPA: phosphoribosylglycinamide formyltransferase [Tenuifilaceae bacterium]|nr:phosphoribosylglycinamide formyltransferase [Tenuifilaceae bacterium]